MLRMKKVSDAKVKINIGPAGFFGWLGLLFIGLKLTGYIDWSWWLVLLPLYGGAAFFFSLAAVLFILGLLIGQFEDKKRY